MNPFLTSISMVFTLGLLGEETFAGSYLYFDLIVVHYGSTFAFQNNNGSTFNFCEKSIKVDPLNYRILISLVLIKHSMDLYLPSCTIPFFLSIHVSNDNYAFYLFEQLPCLYDKNSVMFFRPISGLHYQSLFT